MCAIAHICVILIFLCIVIFPSIFFKKSLVKKSQEQLKVGLVDRIQKNLLGSIDRALVDKIFLLFHTAPSTHFRLVTIQSIILEYHAHDTSL
jgi:hypothetical protein